MVSAIFSYCIFYPESSLDLEYGHTVWSNCIKAKSAGRIPQLIRFECMCLFAYDRRYNMDFSALFMLDVAIHDNTVTFNSKTNPR